MRWQATLSLTHQQANTAVRLIASCCECTCNHAPFHCRYTTCYSNVQKSRRHPVTTITVHQQALILKNKQLIVVWPNLLDQRYTVHTYDLLWWSQNVVWIRCSFYHGLFNFFWVILITAADFSGSVLIGMFDTVIDTINFSCSSCRSMLDLGWRHEPRSVPGVHHSVILVWAE